MQARRLRKASADAKPIDLPGARYWDGVWRERAQQRSVDPRAPGVRNHLRRTFHRFFVETLGDGRGRSLVEIGCADSIWLPYFNRELGFEVVGIDYSETGCVKARSILDAQGVNARVYQVDMFSAPVDLRARFDVVFSYGLIEHFSNSTAAVVALASFCRPGGYVLTIVPNMTSLMGWLQKRFSAEVYSVHVPLTLDQLVAAHEQAQLDVVRAERLLTVNFGVLVPTSPGDGQWSACLKRCAHSVLLGSMVPVWALEAGGIRLMPRSDSLSPYFAVLARA